MALRSARDSQIFIIGCGISGIGAAQKLLKDGFHNVHIIEATARSGGRIRTGRLGMYSSYAFKFEKIIFLQSPLRTFCFLTGTNWVSIFDLLNLESNDV